MYDAPRNAMRVSGEIGLGSRKRRGKAGVLVGPPGRWAHLIFTSSMILPFFANGSDASLLNVPWRNKGRSHGQRIHMGF